MTALESFRQLKDIAGDVQVFIQSRPFQTALVYATSELAMRKVSPEVLEGARQFVEILNQMGPEPEKSPIFKSPIHHDIDHPKPKPVQRKPKLKATAPPEI